MYCIIDFIKQLISKTLLNYWRLKKIFLLLSKKMLELLYSINRLINFLIIMILPFLWQTINHRIDIVMLFLVFIVKRSRIIQIKERQLLRSVKHEIPSVSHKFVVRFEGIFLSLFFSSSSFFSLSSISSGLITRFNV